MPYSAPGLGDSDVDWILGQVNQAQSTLDAQIAEAMSLPDSDLSKIDRITKLNQMKREVDSVYLNLDAQMATWADQDLRGMYQRGHATASSQLGVGYSFTLPHQQAIDILVQDAYDDIGTRLQQVRSAFGANVDLQKMYEGLDPSQITAIQEKTRASIAQMLLTGEDPRKVSKALAQDLWSNGIPIIDSSGRHWNPETYTRMLVRTKSANAYNAGAMNRYAEEGVSRVRVFDGVEDDRDCADANGEIWSLRYAMNNVIEHPNCRRAFAPEQGEGNVDRDTAAKYLVIFDRLNFGIAGVQALRSFRSTGDISVSSTLARLVIEAGKIGAGVPLPFAGSFLQGLLRGTHREVNVWVESYIDPFLYSVGVIKHVPDRALLVKATRPESVIDRITEAVVQSNIDTFGTTTNPKVQAVVNRLDNLVNQAANAIATPGEKGGIKYVDWVVENALAGDRYGQIVAEVVQTVKTGQVDDLKQIWTDAVEYVDDMREIRSVHISAGFVARQQAEEIFLRMDEMLTQMAALMSRETQIDQFPALMDFMRTYGAVNPVDVERVLDFWNDTSRAFDYGSYEVKKMAEVFDAVLEARNRSLARIRELDDVMGHYRAQGVPQRGLLAMAAPSGPDFPSEVSTVWKVDQFNEAFGRMFQKVQAEVVTTPVFDEAQFEDMKSFFFLVSQMEKSTDPDVRQAFEIMSHYLSPKFTQKISGFVELDDIPTQNDQFKFWLNLWDDLEYSPRTGTFTWAGDAVDDKLMGQLIEMLNWFQFDGFFTQPALPWKFILVNHPDPFLLAKYYQAMALPSERDVGRFLGKMFQDMLTTIEDNQRLVLGQGTIVNRIDAWQHTEAFFVRLYGRTNVEQLGNQGINGVVLRVTDEVTGEQMVVKRIISNHSSGPSAAIPSMVGNEVVGGALGDLEILPSRFLTVGKADEVVVVSPYLEDADVWDNRVALIRDDTKRKLAVHDVLVMERDAHMQNYMVGINSSVSVAIDRETSFGLYMGLRGVFDFSEMGAHTMARNLMERQVFEAWQAGNDFTIPGASMPPVKLFKLTNPEVEAFTSLTIDEIKRYYKPLHTHSALFREYGLVIDPNTFDIYVPSGRIGFVDFSRGDVYWGVADFLTESEFRFVTEALDDPDGLTTLFADKLTDALDDVSDATRQAFIDFYDEADDLDETILLVAEEMARRVETRAAIMLRGGAFNITGGVTEYVDRSSGYLIRYGETIKLTNKNTGEVIEGLVINLYEADTSEEVSAIILRNAGMNLSITELRNTGAIRPVAINLDEWTAGNPLEESVDGIIRRAKKTAAQFEDPFEVTGDPWEIRKQPVIDRFGQHIGYDETHVVIDTHAQGVLQTVTFEDPTGQIRTVPLSSLLTTSFLEEFEEYLSNVPPQYKPAKIKLTLQKLSTEDGRPAFGLFDPETGEMTISLIPIFKDQKLVPKFPVIGKDPVSNWVIKIDKPIDELNIFSDLDWSAVNDVINHELGHAVETGLERHRLAAINRLVLEKIQAQAPGISEDLDNLISWADGRVPEWFDTSPYDNPLAALIAYRAGVIEDVLNTNRAVQAAFILEEALKNGNMPPWARAVYAGVLREEPDAHHELYAELWRQLSGYGNPNAAYARLGRSLFGDDFTSTSDIGIAFSEFLFGSKNISVPNIWEFTDEVFIEWLTTMLDPRATRIIPLSRSVNRRQWNAARYNIADIRTRVLHTPEAEGGGGITLNVVTGEQPVSGFSVAKKSNERTFKNVTSDEQFDQIIEDYIDEFENELMEPGWELGLWLDKDGTLYVDTVKIFDDEVSAATFGFRESQKAMFHLDEFETIDLLDGHVDIDAYLKARKIDLSYEERLSQTRKIGGVTKVTGTGEQKLIEERFDEGGKFSILTTKWMKSKDVDRLTDALETRYTVPMTMEKGKANFVELLERGMKIYDSDPDLQRQFGDFYFVWRDAFIRAAADTAGPGRSVRISTEQIAAAAAGMSASLDAGVNLTTVLNMVEILSKDMFLSKKHVDKIKELILRSATESRKRAVKAAAAKTKAAAAKAAKEIAYAKELEALADSFKVGQKLNIMDDRRRMRALAGIISAEGLTPVQVPRRWSFYEKSVAILLGELTPGEALTDTKFRPFYNNIIDPSDLGDTGEVTIDFVMAEAFFQAKGFRDVEHTRPTVEGIQAGLRPLIGDTVRELYEEGWGEALDLESVSQFQSHIWNLWRIASDRGWWSVQYGTDPWYTSLPIVKVKPTK